MTVTPDEARAILNGLRRDGVVADINPVLLAEILAGQADAYARACRENAELRDRIQAARQTLFPLKHDRGLLGQLARTVDAELETDLDEQTGASA